MEALMDTKHTRGPWHLEDDRIVADDRMGPLLVATVRRTKGHEVEGNANGALLAAAPELLDELQHAELVIQTMLNLMSVEQKARMAEREAPPGVQAQPQLYPHVRDRLGQRPLQRPGLPAL
jgi:hypothetical protein